MKLFVHSLSCVLFTIVATREQHSITLINKTDGILSHLNYPHPLPSNIDFTMHLIAQLGEAIHLELYNVVISDTDCHNARIEV